MTQAPALYDGRLMHLRLIRRRGGVKPHRFSYRIFRMWLDIDRIGETLGRLRLVGHNRFNLMSFRERDHGPRDGSALRPWVEALLASEGVQRPARIMLMCFPRMLGYAFNPLALYVAYDQAGAPVGAVYQVRNTDGDLSPYAVNLHREGLRHGRHKNFYVSPFIDADQHYAFTLRPPDEAFALRIRVDGDGGLTLIATENAERRVLSDWNVVRLSMLRPFATWKVKAAIYFEAVRLRLKGAQFHEYPGDGGHYDAAPTALQDAK